MRACTVSEMLKLKAHQSLIGLQELKRSLLGPNPKEIMSGFGSHPYKKLCFPRWLNKYEGVKQGPQG